MMTTMPGSQSEPHCCQSDVTGHCCHKTREGTEAVRQQKEQEQEHEQEEKEEEQEEQEQEEGCPQLTTIDPRQCLEECDLGCEDDLASCA